MPSDPSGEIAPENGANGLGLLWHDDKLLGFGPIAERHGSADPEPFALRGGDLVAHTLADHLTLELREGQKHVERQPAHAACRVEGLGHRHERRLMRVEQIDELGEIGKRAGEAVHLVDDDHIHAAVPHSLEQKLQGRAVERSARESSVIEPVGHERPALVGLALDIGLAGLALRVERVEGKIEIMLGRLARVDGAAQWFRAHEFHGRGSAAWPGARSAPPVSVEVRPASRRVFRAAP